MIENGVCVRLVTIIGQNCGFCMVFLSAVREMVKIRLFFLYHIFFFLLQTLLGEATPANN